jgi:hypothetical protein
MLLAGTALAAAKPHAVSFGKWTAAKWLVEPGEDKTLDLKVAPLVRRQPLEGIHSGNFSRRE